MPRSRSGKFTVNHAGVQALLLGADIRTLMDRKTSEVAAALEGEVLASSKWGQEKVPVQIKTGSYTSYKSPRAAGEVTLAHPAGLALEAKYGYLKKAAASAGLDWGRKNK